MQFGEEERRKAFKNNLVFQMIFFRFSDIFSDYIYSDNIFRVKQLEVHSKC